MGSDEAFPAFSEALNPSEVAQPKEPELPQGLHYVRFIRFQEGMFTVGQPLRVKFINPKSPWADRFEYVLVKAVESDHLVLTKRDGHTARVLPLDVAKGDVIIQFVEY